MKTVRKWGAAPFMWIKGRTLYVSMPFTWLAPQIRKMISSRSFEWDSVIIGGPGAYLVEYFYPDFWEGLPVTIGRDMPGIMQRINPLATRTTTGCIRLCRFCAIGQGIVEPGGLVELTDWPDLPVIADNNPLAASQRHFDRVIDRLIPHGWSDFEQGLDVRLLTEYHARRIAEIKKPIVRLALDSMRYSEQWGLALERLRVAGLSKHAIKSYALIGFDSDPGEAWERCNFIDGLGIQVLPMWFHRLDALKHNKVISEQEKLGWTDYERRRIMQWFYQHKKAVLGRL